jgi:hypothetical protein
VSDSFEEGEPCREDLGRTCSRQHASLREAHQGDRGGVRADDRWKAPIAGELGERAARKIANDHGRI